MKILTYVANTLTVINGDNMFRDVAEKPSFITGENFYYEPTLKLMDGIELNQELELQAEAFISAYVFPTPETFNVEVLSHCVDEDGNYLGYIENDKGYREVIINPNEDYTNKYYDGISFIEGCLINKDTSNYMGIGDTRTLPDAKYAPNTIGDKPFSLERYTYNESTKTWEITLEEAKDCKTAGIKLKHNDALSEAHGTVAFFEVTSYETQVLEALSYIKDNSFSTPLIDGLLTSRGFGETKDELVAKIIAKHEIYVVKFAELLGKFQNLIKRIEVATTVEEVESITW